MEPPLKAKIVSAPLTWPRPRKSVEDLPRAFRMVCAGALTQRIVLQRQDNSPVVFHQGGVPLGEIAAWAPCPYGAAWPRLDSLPMIRAGLFGLAPSLPGRDSSGEPDVSVYRRRGYFIRSPRDLLDRLKGAAMEFASIAVLIAGLIMAALFAVDLLDMR